MANADRYTYREEWSEEDNAYIARCLEFPSLLAHGATPEAALAELHSVVSAVVADMEQEGESIPEPLESKVYSGKLV